MQKMPYVLIIGEKEESAKSVAVRQRGKGDLGQIKLEELIKKLKKELEDKN